MGVDAVMEAILALRPGVQGMGGPGLQPTQLGLDAAQAEHGLVAEAQGAQGTVYWLQGPLHAAPAADIRLIAELLGRARDAAAAAPETQLLRLSFMPAACERGAADAPALHGYRLATAVRRRLGLPADAPVDLPAVLRRLGVAVEPLRFSEAGPGAAAALDARRGAAAIAVHAGELRFFRNPRLVRVALAHELCHLLFDPPRGVGVGLSLDPSEEPAPRRAPTDAQEALEKRARAFAAELLLPTAGLVELLGQLPATAPTPELVAQAAARFDTPLEIARLHIQNRLDRTCELGELQSLERLAAPQWSLASLLGPLRLQPRRSAPAVSGLPDALGAPLDAPSAEVAACDAATAQLMLLGAELDPLAPVELAARVVGVFDDLAEGEHHAALTHTLDRFAPSAWPEAVLIGLLTHLSWLDPRPPGFDGLLVRALDALRARGWEGDRVARFTARLAGGAA